MYKPLPIIENKKMSFILLKVMIVISFNIVGLFLEIDNTYTLVYGN